MYNKQTEHLPPAGPPPSQLNTFDPNENHPDEPPPSYDESVKDPSFTDQQQGYTRPENPPPRPSRPDTTQNQPVRPVDEKYRPPSSPPPVRAPPGPPPSQAKTIKLRKPTPINPNPYLPWEYSSSYRCSKCENTGFRTKNGKPCKKCWPKFRPGVIPPSSQAELERLVKNPPPPKPLNANVRKLPPGAVPLAPMGVAPMGAPMPQIVQPGDPRIGGVLCPRCHGRGMVHFFLDLERCSTCNGLGRVNFNGRPL